jgi:DNA repair exonuclease SbcCD ATPase subunit
MASDMLPEEMKRQDAWSLGTLKSKYDHLIELFKEKAERLDAMDKENVELDENDTLLEARKDKLRDKILEQEEELKAFQDTLQMRSQDVVRLEQTVQTQSDELDKLRRESSHEILDELLVQQTKVVDERDALLNKNEELEMRVASLLSGISPTRVDLPTDQASSSSSFASTERQLRDELIELDRKFNRSEEKIQQCNSQRLKLQDLLRDAEASKMEYMSEIIRTQRSKMGEVCTRKCEEWEEECKELRKRLWHVAKAVQEHGDALRDVVGEVMHGVE